MTILLASVHHSGTRFVQRALFGELRFHSPRFCAGGDAVHLHIDARHKQHLEYWLNAAKHIVVPLRHPYRLFSSWKGRRGSTEKLEDQLKMLCGWVDTFSPLYLPIDHVDRLDYLVKMTDAMGIWLSPDWARVGGESKPVRLTERELLQVEWWAEQPLFKAYYASISDSVY